MMQDSSQSAEKQRIADTFSQAAPGYAGAAILQQRIAQQLLAQLPDTSASHVIDLGCGSGSQLPLLQQQFPGSVISGFDLSHAMLAAVETAETANFPLVTADIEALPLPASSVDIIYSSLAIQWCRNLSTVLAECRRVLKPGGLFAFSTLTAGSLAELGSAWASTDSFQHANHYADFNSQAACIEPAGFQALHLAQRTELCHFPSFTDLLRNLKETGVNTVVKSRRPGLLTPGQLRGIGKRYEAYREPAGLPLRYEVMYAVVATTQVTP